MQKSLVITAVCAAVVAGCAAPGTPRMSETELIECLQPNRRVVVEVGGLAAKPPPKPKPGAAPPAKPPKPAFAPATETGLAQGNHAFDPGSAVLKEGGQKELDAMIGRLKKRAIKVNSIIISGHTDRIEERTAKNLSEQRAMAVRTYLVERGLDEKLMFWEGKGAREPVAVTKFCE
jgi:outer membrane protein OmpA-like peptidoglycan-associated protein